MTKQAAGSVLSLVLISVLLLSVVPRIGLADDAPASATPDGQVTIMGRGGDSMVEGTLDLLAPVYRTPSGLLFVNPRFSYDDGSESEVNVGLGYRQLFGSTDLIIGGNLYYDSRWPGDGTQFNQFGAGLEVLSKWVDARFNYYLPENNKEVVDVQERTTLVGVTSTKTYEQHASGYALYETIRTTTTETSLHEVFTTMVGTMDGFDAELGFRLPLLSDKFETRLFGGYYRFSPNLNIENVEGFKARIEVRALPALILDAEYYDDDRLFGSSYMVGGRVQLPFDVVNLVHGRNPFEGTTAAFTHGSRPFAARLTENVVRDPHIQVCKKTETTSETTQDTTTSDDSYKYLRNMIFVDGDNSTGVEDGTFQHPFNTVQEGVDAAKERGFGRVYVFAARNSYNENVVIDADLDLMGEGKRLGTDGGFGGGVFPVIDGSAGSSAALNVNGANSVVIRGFNFMNTGAGFDTAAKGAATPDMAIPAGVVIHNTAAVQFSDNQVHDTPAGLLAIYGLSPVGMAADVAVPFSLDVRHNRFWNTGLAIGVVAQGASGNVNFQYNRVDGSLAGVGIIGVGNASIAAVPDGVVNAVICNNEIHGGFARLDQMVMGNLLTGALDLFGLAVPEGHPAMLVPSVAGVITLATPGTEMNLLVTDNEVLDNLVGIGIGSIGGRVTADIERNSIRGAGLAGAIDLINAHSDVLADVLPDGLQFDGGLIGLGAFAYGPGSSVTMTVGNNTIERNGIGIGVVQLLAVDGASMDCAVAGNVISDNLVGVAGVAFNNVPNYVEPVPGKLSLSVTGNIISGGGGEDIVALLDGVRAPVGQYGALGVAVLGYGAADVTASITDNAIQNHILGVGVGSLYGAEISSLTISGNSITGAGVNDVMGAVLASQTFKAPLVSQTVSADFGALGIGLVAMDGSILDARVTGNTVDGHALGIGAIALNSANLDAEIAGNVLNNDSFGIGAVAIGPLADMNLKIHDNALNGGGPDLAAALGGFLPSGFDAGAGIICAATDGAHLTMDIRNNSIRDSSGFGVFAFSGTGSSRLDLTLASNVITGHGLFGVVMESDTDATFAARIDGNTVLDNNTSGLVPEPLSSSVFGLTEDTSSLDVSPLRNNVTDGDYYLGYDPGATVNYSSFGNTLEDLVTPAGVVEVPAASVPTLPW